MNDLFSGSFSCFHSEENSPPSRYQNNNNNNIEMTGNSPSTGDVNLDKFFEDVEAIKDELRALGMLHNQLQSSHKHIKTLHNAKPVKDLRSKMDNDVVILLKEVKFIEVRLEALDRSNAANRSLPRCGPRSSSNRTRTSVVNGLRKKLFDSMNSFNDLRNKISSEYSELWLSKVEMVMGGGGGGSRGRRGPED